MNYHTQSHKRILITGSAGMLGSAMYPAAQKKCSEVLATDIITHESHLAYLDVRDKEACAQVFKEFNPQIVLHLAAHTDLEYCERNEADAHATNSTGTHNIAQLCKENDATLAYISTAGVFDGEKEFYTEEDAPNPINVYGRSKYQGEIFVNELCPSGYIFRAGWMMGGGPEKDKKFINKIFGQISAGKKEIFAVTDKTGAPTYTVDFAKSLFQVIENENGGLYNQVCLGNCTRYDVAKAFIEDLGLTHSLQLTPVDSDFFKDEYFALRPPSESLLNHHLEMAGLNIMRTWQECLAEYSQEYKNILASD